MPKVFAAQSSDLSGPTNPGGIWSPAFLALKQALDRGDAPENVLQALYDWMSKRGVEPSQLDNILQLEPEAAYDALLGLAGQDKKALPSTVKDTLHRTLQYVARRYAQNHQQDLNHQQSELNSLRARYGLESASKIVRHLLQS